MLMGLKTPDETAIVNEYTQALGFENDYAAQTIVEGVVCENKRSFGKSTIPIVEEFLEGSRAIFRRGLNYSRPLEMVKHDANKVDIWNAAIVGRYASGKCLR